MSAEITYTANLTIAPSAMAPFTRAISNVVDMSGDNYIHNKKTIPVGNGSVSTALELGGVGTPGWGWFKNLDSVNYLTIRNGNAGDILFRLLPGIEVMVPLDPAVVPYARPNDGDIELEYCIAAQ